MPPCEKGATLFGDPKVTSKAHDFIIAMVAVLYSHPGEDPAEFDRYYRDVHVPLAKKMNGLVGLDDWEMLLCRSRYRTSPGLSKGGIEMKSLTQLKNASVHSEGPLIPHGPP